MNLNRNKIILKVVFTLKYILKSWLTRLSMPHFFVSSMAARLEDEAIIRDYNMTRILF